MKLLKIVTIIAGLLIGNAYANDKPKLTINEILDRGIFIEVDHYNHIPIAVLLEELARFGNISIKYDTKDNQIPQQLIENAVSFNTLSRPMSEILNVVLAYHCYGYQIQDDNLLLITKTDDCNNQKFSPADGKGSIEFADIPNSRLNDIVALLEDKKLICIKDLKVQGQENMYIQYPEYYYNKKFYINTIDQTLSDVMEAMAMVNCQDYKFLAPDYLIVAQSDNCPAFSPATTDDENKLKALLNQPFNKANLENSADNFKDLADFIRKNTELSIIYPTSDTELLPQKDDETLYERLKSELDNRCLTYRFVNDKFVVFVPVNDCQS